MSDGGPTVAQLTPEEARMVLRLMPVETPVSELARKDGARSRLESVRDKLLRIAGKP